VPLEAFAGANVYASHVTPGHTAYRIITASPGGEPVHTTNGLVLAPDTELSQVTAPHTVLIPGCPVDQGGAFVPDPDVVAWVRQRAPRCRRIVSICTGAFFGQAAGLPPIGVAATTLSGGGLPVDGRWVSWMCLRMLIVQLRGRQFEYLRVEPMQGITCSRSSVPPSSALSPSLRP